MSRDGFSLSGDKPWLAEDGPFGRNCWPGRPSSLGKLGGICCGLLEAVGAIPNRAQSWDSCDPVDWQSTTEHRS